MKQGRIKKLLMETLGALAIVTLGFIVAAMFSFAACSSSEQCTDTTTETILVTD